MVSALSLIVSMLALGYLFGRFERMPDTAAAVLNRFIIDICLPAMILRLLPKLTLDRSLIALLIVPWTLGGLSFLIAKVAARPLRLDVQTRAALVLVTALGNTAFLGYPLCGALLGEGAVPLATVYDQVGSFLILAVVAPIVLGRATSGPGAGVGAIVRRVVLFPPFLSLIVAVLPLPMPGWLDPLLTAAAAPLIPLAMFAVGLNLRFSLPRPARVLAAGLIMKLVLFPAVAWLITRALGTPPAVRNVAVLESAMPTMITAGALLMAQGIVPELVAAFVSWGLLISLVTVPAWSLLLR